MALDSYTIVRPNQINQAGDTDALMIEEFTGMVEGTIARKSAVNDFVPVKPVKGTNTLTSYAVGEATLQALVPGTTPDGTAVDFNKASLTVDTVVLARNFLPMLDIFQTSFDARSEIAKEHGKKIAKLYDQSFLIQACKSAQLANSVFSGTDGHLGGSKVTMALAGDNADPVKLYAKIRDMFEAMELKDVDVIGDDVALWLTPSEYYTLMDSNYVINGEYVTSAGTSVKGKVFDVLGVPVRVTNNLPKTNIASHLLGSNYTGDFTKMVACAFSARALLAGETIPLQSKVWWDEMSKQWCIDSWLAFGVTPHRAEYSGCILLP